MSVITHHTTLPDSAQKTDFYNIIDNATCTAIVDADIASTAAIQDIKLASITTAGKVDGSAMNNLANVPSGAGAFPIANIPSIPNSSLTAGVGVSANNIVALDGSAKLPAVDGSQLTGLTALFNSISILDYGTSTSASTQRGIAGGSVKICYGQCVDGNSITNLPFSSGTTYVAVAMIKASSIVTQNVQATAQSGSSCTISDGLGNGNPINWFMIGT